MEKSSQDPAGGEGRRISPPPEEVDDDSDSKPRSAVAPGESTPRQMPPSRAPPAAADNVSNEASAGEETEDDEEEREERYTEFDRQHTGDDDDDDDDSAPDDDATDDDDDNIFAAPATTLDSPPPYSPSNDEIRKRQEEHWRRQRQAEAESVAYAGAFAGETLVESPVIVAPPTFSQGDVEDLVRRMESMNEKNNAGNEATGTVNRMDRTGGRSGSNLDGTEVDDDDDDDDGDYERVNYFNDYGPNAASQDAEDGGDTGPGLIGSARNWWTHRREARRRLELERQVELQRRKLQLEARMASRAKLTRRADGGVVRDGGGAALEAKLQAVTGDRAGRKVAAEAAWGGSGGAESSGVVAGIIGGVCGVDSGEDNYGGVSGSGSADTDDSFFASDDDGKSYSGNGTRKRSMKISRAQHSLSGDGIAVSVELPDDDDTGQDENFQRVAVVSEDSSDKAGNPLPNPNPFVLSPAHMSQISARVLPPALLLNRWRRLYSLARDGDSFDAFLRLTEGASRSLLVIRTTAGEVFGAYSDSPYEATRHRYAAGTQASSYYGSAQACLWRVLPPSSGGGVDGEVTAYKWSGANRYIQLVDVRHKMIAFGGGGNAGEFGLCVEDDFRRGSTGPCGTFGNDPLCDKADGGAFEVVDVECWGFLSGFG